MDKNTIGFGKKLALSLGFSVLGRAFMDLTYESIDSSHDTIAD
jgi:hypothetical protein